MNGDGNAPLLCKREDRAIIVGIERQSGIVRVKLDAVQRMIINGAAERVTVSVWEFRTSISAKA